jgi:ribosomal protein S18 acetylase RimI-like enzyme
VSLDSKEKEERSFVCVYWTDEELRDCREEEPTDGVQHGHVTSISVLRSYRRLGLANKLMKQSRRLLGDAFLNLLVDADRG